jgi:AbrB family looped-hinge helix DNA binding protein
MTVEIVKVTRNAQVTIPKSVREALGIKEGDTVKISIVNGKIVVEKVKYTWPKIRLGKKITNKDVDSAILAGMEEANRENMP